MLICCDQVSAMEEAAAVCCAGGWAGGGVTLSKHNLAAGMVYQSVQSTACMPLITVIKSRTARWK